MPALGKWRQEDQGDQGCGGWVCVCTRTRAHGEYEASLGYLRFSLKEREEHYDVIFVCKQASLM